MDRQSFLNLNFFNDRLAKNPKDFPYRYGLRNLGNTCFMNSILNCLFGELELNQLVLNPHHFDSYSRDDRLKFMKHFANLVRAASSNKPDLINIGIENFVKMVRFDTRESNLFPKGQQADAHEFLVYMIGRLKQQIYLVLPSLYPHRDRFDTIFNEFQIGLSQVSCCERNHRSESYFREEVLSLSIENNNNILECLSEFFRPVNFMRCICSSDGCGHNDRNRDCNPFRCDKCGMHVSATITLEINYLPTILILHLKRFRYNPFSGQLEKINRHIDIESENLKFSSYVDRFVEHFTLFNDHTYQLYAICFHIGRELMQGHYTCFSKNPIDRKWRYYDDNKDPFIVQDIQAYMSNHSLEPYVLFYKLERQTHIDDVSPLTPALRYTSNPFLTPVSTNMISSGITFSRVSNGFGTPSSLRSRSASSELDVSSSQQNSQATQKLCENARSPSVKRKQRKQSEDQRRKNSKVLMQKKRSDQESRIQEQQKNTNQHRSRRLNEENRVLEQARNTEEHHDRRQNAEYRAKEQARNTEEHWRRSNSKMYLIKRYEDGIREGPNHICVCCGGLFFRRSVQVFESDARKSHVKSDLLNQIFCVRLTYQDSYWICLTCHESIVAGKVPTMCHSKGLHFPEIAPCLKDLNELEERLLSPRIAFLRIKPLAWDKQSGLVGNAVNVPVDINTTLQQLPRTFQQCETIKLQFMRRMEYNKAYIEDVVRVRKLKEAIDYLVQQPLYKLLHIEIKQDWISDLVKEDSDAVTVGNETTWREVPREEVKKEPDSFGHFTPDPNKQNDQIHETLLVDDFDHLKQLDSAVHEETCGNEQDVAKIAPGQRSFPISLTTDEYGEELTFLKIFGGQLRSEELKKLSYGTICKSYFRSFDRRCAENIMCIFYMYKKLIAHKLISSINICLKKYKIQQNLKVKDVLTRTRIIENFMNTEDAKRIFRTIRPSPAYWLCKKKDLFAMIRQIGVPSFFITLSPAEIEWPQLLVLLVQILENKTISEEEAEKLDKNVKIDLLRRDPITTARYFENRIRHLFNYMLNKESGPFADNPIVDYYWRVEFQTRGSPHVHMMIWCENTPIYDRLKPQCQGNQECVVFIDKYITAKNPDTGYVSEDEETFKKEPEFSPYKPSRVPISFQKHKHRFNCLVDNLNPVCNDVAKLCKYGFPWPILDETIILEPLHKEHKAKEDDYKKMYANIRYELNKLILERKRCIKSKEPVKEVTQDQFLKGLNISFANYILALRSSIQKTKVFLKRSSHDLMINPYMKELYVRHHGNMDIQYITDAHGVVAYLTDYINKSPAVMSRLLNIAAEEIASGNLSIREKFNRMANKFQNCSEVSAQECVYHLLSMPVSYCSREVQFILTFPENERYSMLKDKKLLKKMSKESSDIYQKGTIDHYINRPDEFEQMCLAEFVGCYDYYSNDRYKKRYGKIGYYFNEDDRDDDLLEELLKADDNVSSDEEMEAFEPHTTEQVPIKNKKGKKNEQDEDKKFIQLKAKDGYVKLRKSTKILRYRRYTMKQNYIEYVREQLMLFSPWRNEKEDIGDKVQRIKAFEENAQVIAKNKAMFETVFREESEKDAFDQVLRDIEAYYDMLEDENAHKLNKVSNRMLGYDDNNDQENDYEGIEDAHGYHGELNYEKHVTLKGPETAQEVKAAKRLQDDEFKEIMVTLNRGQHMYLINVLSLLKQKQVFYHYVTGDAGTGKSRLIKALRETMSRHYSKYEVIQDAESLYVLLAAFTGKAAFNIKGTTLHTAFSIQVKSSKMTDLATTSGDKIRKMYANLKLIIIDEISLCGASLFRIVDHRLRQIFDSDKIFGGIPMIVLGDFKQLQPVKDKYVFDVNGYDGYEKLSTLMLWRNFRLYELTECMRQRDDKAFAEALTTIGRYGMIGLTDRQVALLNSRIVKEQDIPSDAIFLFFENAKVHELNQKRLREMTGDDYLHICRDEIKPSSQLPEHEQIDINHVNQVLRLIHTEKKEIAPYSINLKVGAKYMLIKNLNIEDGLVNGTCGRLARIAFDRKNTSRAKCLWFDFMEPDVGVNTRERYGAPEINSTKDKLLTPISESSDQIKYNYNKLNCLITREQFPLIECEALTIHKSQGQTYTCVAFDLSQKFLTKQLIYVALSRCTSLTGLYLYGQKHLYSGATFERYKEEERLEKAAKDDSVNIVSIEMARLRKEALFINLFAILNERPDFNDSSIIIMFHNVASFRRKYDYLNRDYACKNCDVLLLSECHTIPHRDREASLDDFNLLRVSGTNDANSASGQMCFFNKKSQVGHFKFVSDNTSGGLYKQIKDHLELSLFEMSTKSGKRVYICHVYNHPGNLMRAFWQEFTTFLRSRLQVDEQNRVESNLFVLGDFNIDLLDNDRRLAKMMRDELGLIFVHKSPTTDRGTCIDWCLTNVVGGTIGYGCQVYESYFSDHKPIILTIENF